MRHDAQDRSEARRDARYDDPPPWYHIEKKKADAKNQGKNHRRDELLEKEGRAKYVNGDHDPSRKVTRFFAVGKCAHCFGDHFGYPSQSDPIANSDGHLTQVPCPIQDCFRNQYGDDAMREVITQRKVRCKFHVATINGLPMACNGKHPTHILSLIHI